MIRGNDNDMTLSFMLAEEVQQARRIKNPSAEDIIDQLQGGAK